jgi:hypothetical protein
MWRIESAYLADLLRFESESRLMDFYHRTNYGQNGPINKEILVFNEYCGLFGFRDHESRFVFFNAAEAISNAVCVSFCELFL